MYKALQDMKYIKDKTINKIKSEMSEECRQNKKHLNTFVRCTKALRTGLVSLN